jgi:hypothetical protein
MVLADVESYLILACRGFLLVGLVSWQTRNLQRGGAIRIAVGAFLLGCAWYGNVLAAVEQVPGGWLPYACGSALGAVAGWRVSRIRIAWR